MGKGYLSYTMAMILQALENGYRYGSWLTGHSILFSSRANRSLS
jgi:hypothetical protein